MQDRFGNELQIGDFVRIIAEYGEGKIVRIVEVGEKEVRVNLYYPGVDSYSKHFENIEKVTSDEAMLYLLEQ